MAMRLIESKGFSRQLRNLSRRGGIATEVHRQLVGAIEMWHRGLTPSIQPTNHGESRIKHAVKYSLRDAYRLVTTEHNDNRILLFVGTHDEVDEWLENHKGWDQVIGKKGDVRFAPTLETVADTDEMLDDASIAFASGPLFARLSQSHISMLNLSPALLSTIQLVVTYEKVDEEECWTILDALGYSSIEEKQVTLQVINLLRQGLVDEARKHIELYAHEATAAADSPERLIEAIEDGTASDELVDLSKFSERELREIFSRSDYADWLLFLHPTQQKLVDDEHGGAARLLGVSGSGKTCVLVHRANLLAKRYPKQPILILVLNESLKYLIENLVERLCHVDQRSQISVRRIYDYCYTAVKRLEPLALIERLDERSGEDLDRCWRDFIRKPHAIEATKPLRTPLLLRDVDPWQYLRDELIWIRSGFGKDDRREYLSCERSGRGVTFPLYTNKSSGAQVKSPTGFPSDTRKRVLDLLDHYEEYMQEGGLLDEDGVALRAFGIRNRISSTESLRARCVLIDEVQDCSTIQLAVVAEIPTDSTDGLFLVGDPVQKVFPRQQHLPSANIDIKGRATILKINYRNTKQVLEAAFQIITSFQGKCPVTDADILQPEYAKREGPRPKLVICESREEQLACIGRLLLDVQVMEMGTCCVAVPANQSLDDVVSLCKRKRWPQIALSSKSTLEEVQKSVVTSHFEDMKGHEFRFVYLMNLSDQGLLSKAIPKEELWRIAFQIYVAMTRAQDELWLFSVGRPSTLLEPLLPFVDHLKPADLI